MPPKPRQTIRVPPPSSSSSSSTQSSNTIKPVQPSGKLANIRRKRWVHDKPTLSLLLLLHASCHVFAFILLTEPCLNPHYVNSLWSKTRYLSLLTTEGLIPEEEWKERFLKAGIRGLFGVGVVQAWFVARLNSYVQKGEREHGRLVSALKMQREKGLTVGISNHHHHHHYEGEEREIHIPLVSASHASQSNNQKQSEQDESTLQVGSFIRQLESVSMTFLGLPFIWLTICILLVMFGAPLLGKDNFSATAILAAHLTLLIGLPIIHILGLPGDTSPSPSTSPSHASSSSSPLSTITTTTTNIKNANIYYQTLFQLKPNPTFLYPLFYPLIFSLFATLLSTSTLILDWNVAWQTYPFPLLVAPLIGLILGNLYSLFILLFG
ncbi:uncharacterized protein UTRI_02768_B [Ustilago trichophora]|uniref:Uncharacterized protein n=1 Tax=Ustilago trichophora TaxID=86804 RepID=A0A5C3E3Z3_9BASI|nr:uncharacterized protein UTRI_02768_B [Ustilago trichophora]